MLRLTLFSFVKHNHHGDFVTEKHVLRQGTGCFGPAIIGKAIPYEIRLHCNLSDLEIKTDGSTSTPISSWLNGWCLLELQRNKVLSTGKIIQLAENNLHWKFLSFLGSIICFTEQTEFTVVQKPKTWSMSLLKTIELTARQDIECLNLGLWCKWYSCAGGNIQNISLK